MHTIYKYILGAALFLGLGGCSKFLEEKSQDEVKPSTVSELQQLLMGEVYPAGSSQTSFHAYLELMTDDATSNFNTHKAAPASYQRYAGAYTWQDNMFESMADADVQDDIDTYDHYYRRIMGCNVVLDMIDKVRGNEEERENVRGQALAMRSFFYFMLVNLFAQPYNAAGVDITTSPGVELILSPVVHDAYPTRVSIARTYEQVEADLLKALPLLEQYGTNNSKYRATDVFVKGLLSRMYLYMEKWDKAAQYATQALERNAGLLNLASIKFPIWNYQPAIGVYSSESPEAIWMGYGGYYEYRNIRLGPYGPPVYAASPDLRSKYEYDPSNTANRGDLRMRYFFYWDYLDGAQTILDVITGDKFGGSLYNQPSKGMRVAEMYLNRAESNIQLYLKNGEENLRKAAMDDLNHLRSFRYDTRNVSYVPVDYSGTALLDFCRDERRRELNFEDHRWFDLRRYGMPEIRHPFRISASQAPMEYVLKKDDKRYVLPIPRSVLAKNPALVPNP
jgi:hypothetical protein